MSKMRISTSCFRTHRRPLAKHPISTDQPCDERIQPSLHTLGSNTLPSYPTPLCISSSGSDSGSQPPLQDQQQLVHRDELGQILRMCQGGGVNGSDLLWPGSVGEQEGHHQSVREAYNAGERERERCSRKLVVVKAVVLLDTSAYGSCSRTRNHS
jgi:hypothetical protein